MNFAQIAEGSGLPLPFLNALVIYGPMGVTLAWFMWRAEKKLEEVALRAEKRSDQVMEHLGRLSHRINGITKAMLMDVISRDNHHGAAKEAAQRMLVEMEASDASRTATD